MVWRTYRSTSKVDMILLRLCAAPLRSTLVLSHSIVWNNLRLEFSWVRSDEGCGRWSAPVQYFGEGGVADVFVESPDGAGSHLVAGQIGRVHESRTNSEVTGAGWVKVTLRTSGMSSTITRFMSGSNLDRVSWEA